jgi:hypothetical protein
MYMHISACVSNNQIVSANVVVSVDFSVLEILEISFAYMQSSLQATTKIIFTIMLLRYLLRYSRIQEWYIRTYT